MERVVERVKGLGWLGKELPGNSSHLLKWTGYLRGVVSVWIRKRVDTCLEKKWKGHTWTNISFGYSWKNKPENELLYRIYIYICVCVCVCVCECVCVCVYKIIAVKRKENWKKRTRIFSIRKKSHNFCGGGEERKKKEKETVEKRRGRDMFLKNRSVISMNIFSELFYDMFSVVNFFSGWTFCFDNCILT